MALCKSSLQPHPERYSPLLLPRNIVELKAQMMATAMVKNLEQL